MLQPLFSCCLSAAGIRFLGTLSRQGLPPLLRSATDRPAHTRACRADPDEVSTFRTYETRTGPGALYTPGTAVLAGRRLVRGRRLPPLNGRPLASRYSDPAGMYQ